MSCASATNLGVRKLFSDTAIFALLPNLSRVISVAMLPLLTPYLTSYDYGVNGVLLAYAAAFEGMRDLGLGLVLTNSFFQDQKDYPVIWRRVYGLLCIWGLLFSSVQAGLIYLALPAQEMHNFTAVCLCIAVPGLLADHTTTIGRLHFQLHQRPVPIVLAGLGSALLAAFVNYICIAGFRQGYMGFLYAGALAKMFTASIYGYVLLVQLHMFPVFVLDHKWVKKTLKTSFPLVPHYYSAYLLNTSDRVLMTFFSVPTAQIGVYSFGQSLGGYFAGIGKAIAQAFTPALMALYKQGSRFAENRAKDLLLLAQTGLLFGGFTVALWSREIVALLARTPTLNESYQIAIPIILGQTIYPIYFGAVSKLRFAEKTECFWRISFLAGLLSVGANLLLIPWAGMKAAAWVSFFSYLYFGFSGYFAAPYRQIRVANYHLGAWLTLILMCVGVAYFCRDFDIVFRVPLTVVAAVVSGMVLIRVGARLRARSSSDQSRSNLEIVLARPSSLSEQPSNPSS